METGLFGALGEYAALLAEEECVVECEFALILLHKTEVDYVLDQTSKLIIVTPTIVRVSFTL